MGKGKYQEWLTHEGLTKLEGWARDGLTDEQIAYNVGIRRPTLYEWKKSHPDISDALKKGKEVVDREVESALLKRAKGFIAEDVTETTDDEGTITKTVRREVPPDTTAAIFWLKNRKPDEWRDRKETELSGGVGVQVSDPYKNLSEEQLAKLADDDDG